MQGKKAYFGSRFERIQSIVAGKAEQQQKMTENIIATAPFRKKRLTT